MRKYRLTLLFAVTAVVVIAIAAIIANHVIGNLAEDNLIKIAEDNTAREALHIEAMTRGEHSLQGTVSAGATAGGDATQNIQQPVPLAQSLAAYEGLLNMVPQIAEGLNVVKISLSDLDGRTVWSTDPNALGEVNHVHTWVGETAEGGVTSEFVRDEELVDLSGTLRTVDVVETYLPLQDRFSGRIMGLLDIHRDASNDVALQVDDAKSAVLWTTLGTMRGLFLVLFGFIVVADVSIYRSNRREMSVVEEANRTLEDRVRQRTQELEASNLQLVEAQDRLVRTEKLAALGQLAGDVAHDLRNPLGAIRNAVYYLKRRLGTSEVGQSNPRIPQFLQIMDDEVEHSNQIITDLMTFARVNAPSLSPTVLEKVIKNSLSSLEIRDNVHMDKTFDPDLPEVMADGEQLQRVFTNLAMNAQDAMPDGGDLTIIARRVDGYAEVAFSDTGIGIDHEDMEKVFEPLFTTKATGTGRACLFASRSCPDTVGLLT